MHYANINQYTHIHQILLLRRYIYLFSDKVEDISSSFHICNYEDCSTSITLSPRQRGKYKEERRAPWREPGAGVYTPDYSTSGQLVCFEAPERQSRSRYLAFCVLCTYSRHAYLPSQKRWRRESKWALFPSNSEDGYVPRLEVFCILFLDSSVVQSSNKITGRWSSSVAQCSESLVSYEYWSTRASMLAPGPPSLPSYLTSLARLNQHQSELPSDQE